MGVSFDDGPIHEGSGVSLVGVADQVLLVGNAFPGQFPFLGGCESAATASAQAALDD